MLNHRFTSVVMVCTESHFLQTVCRHYLKHTRLQKEHLPRRSGEFCDLVMHGDVHKCGLRKQRTARAQDPDCLPGPSPGEERLLRSGGSARRRWQQRALQESSVRAPCLRRGHWSSGSPHNEGTRAAHPSRRSGVIDTWTAPWTSRNAWVRTGHALRPVR